MIKCPTCGTDNLDGSQFCDECGASLSAAVAGGGNDQPNPQAEILSPSFAPPSQGYHPSAANVTSVGIPSFVEETKIAEEETEVSAKPETGSDDEANESKGVHAVLTIERGASVGTEFGLTSDESYIGRWDADNGIFPDVDLDSHDPEAKVSRRHARIIRGENGRYQLEDLGSTNGTFVNRGRRLIPGSPQPLNDGDELIVGKTFLRFRLNQ